MKSKIYSKLILAIVIFLCLQAGKVFSQTTYISGATGNGDFESGSTGWTGVNGADNEWWPGGTTSFCAGTKGAYIGTKTTVNTYLKTTAFTNHLYKSINFTAGETTILLSFTYKGNGESTYDGLKVYVTAAAPVAGTQVSSSDQLGATWYNMVGTTCTNVANLTVPGSYAGTTKYLVFSWINDASGGADNAITIDNIILTSAPCPLSGLPYTESFESITVANTLPTCMAATNLGSKVYTYIAPTGSYNQAARTGTDYASFKYSCDDWIYTQGLALTSGVAYNFSFWYVTDGLSGWTTLNAFFGNAQNSGAMTTAITGATVSGPTNTNYVQITGTFTPSSTGTFYCGIHCLSSFSPWYLTVDDINITAMAACSGTPTGGTAVTSASPICPSTPVNLSVTGGTTGSGLTYQWQSSPDNSVWTDIGGATSATYSPSPTTTTWYRRKITCTTSGLFAYSSSVQVVVSGSFTIPYTESFESITVANTLPSCMAATNLGTKVKTYIAPTGSYNQAARTGTDYASFYYPADDWVFTQGLSLTSGVTYNFSFWYITDGYSGWTTLEAKFGNAQNSGAMTTAISGATVSLPTNTTYEQITGTFTPSSTGTFYCGIHCLSNSTPYYLTIDDINITAASPMVYSSCTTTQLNTTDVAQGTTAQEIIGIQIVTTGTTSPLSVTSFTVNANGSTAIADINAANSAKIYYTGTSSTFATTTYFGQNTPTIANFNITGSQTLSTGTNYFWLVYDIKATAILGNVVDGQCTSLNVGVARTPTVTAPAGNRLIALIYCTPAPSSVDGTGITNVTCGAINNTTGAEAGNYGNYTAQVATFMQTTIVTVNITFSTGYTYVTKIWVDWNLDGDFDDAGEEVYSGESLSANPTTLLATFIVPAGASVGNHRMRIGGADTGPPTPCYTGTYASYEDYTLNVTALPACAGTPTGGSAVATPSTKCASETSVISLSGATVASGITFQWQWSPNPITTWTNITGATSATYNSSATVNTNYRCVVTCTNSGLSANSASALLTVNNCIIIGGGTSSTNFPTPYIGSYEDGRSQYIVTAAELTAQGLTPGSALTALSFNVATKASTAAYKGFTIQIGHTASSTYSSAAWLTPAFTSCVSGNYTVPAAGWNLHSFTTNFTWNGIDNIVIQACFNNTAFTSADPVYYTTVSNTVCYAEQDAGLAGCSLAAESYGSSRPNMKFNYNPGPPCSGTPSGGTASSSITSFCNTATPVLSLTGYTYATGITFQWQYSVSNSPYSWADITGAQSPTYAVNPAINQTRYFRCAVSCGANTGYSTIVTLTNTAQNITGTNSPVTVVCNTAANLTATATGGTISWYANATGGTALATGGSYSPVVTANTTFYCAAGSGGSSSNVGKPTWTPADGYVGISNWGIRFNAISAFTLVSVKVYPETAGTTISVVLQDNTGTPIGSPITFTAGPAGVIQTLTLNMSIPIGNDYRLVTGNSTSLARGSTGLAFPYTLAGICSITASEWGGTTTGTYYYFYDWVVSTGCESSPRTPVNVIVSGGVTAPVCSGTPSPAHNATGVCPIGTILSWTASATACQTATGYKLYFGTDAAATNIYNGLDIGNVTSYNLGTILGTQIYYWKIVPYNTAGDAAGCSIWKFTTAANPGALCAMNMGIGVINVPSLPHSEGNGTTKNKINNITSANAVSCGSSSYFSGEDQVWIFTPATSGSITINLTSGGSYTGLMLYDGCPLLGVTCGAIQGNCIAYSQSSTGTKTMTACVTAGITYYLVLDSYALPDWNDYSNLTISAPSGSVATNDLPCNAISLALGATANGNNACTGGASEPATPGCWTYGILNTIWYSVVCPASGSISIMTTLGTLTNTQIAVYSGSCASLSMVSGACNDNISGCGSGSDASQLMLTGLTPGATYYIRVDGGYDLIGSFSITAIDGNSSFAITPGQDCDVPIPTCISVLQVSDPGYSGTGSICDFDGTYDCTGGDRAAVFYTIEIAQNGTLAFDIIPNDYSGGLPGDGTDYDFIVWKIAGSGTLATCSSILTNSSTGMMACNYSYIDVTGLYPGGGANPAIVGSGWDAAYEDVITVQAGDKYLLWVSNYSLSTSGFTLDFTGTAAGVINYSPNPTLIAWTGSLSTVWTNTTNWGGCNIPSCLISAVISSNVPIMPTISSNVTVKDLTIYSGATLTINTGNKLTICGNFVNNGTVVFNGTSTLEFAGTTPQTFTSNTALTISNIIINNPGGVTLVGSAGNIIVTGTFTLTSGILTTSSSAMLIMNAGSTVAGTPAEGNATSYVDGPMRKIGNTAFIFPLGDGTRWAPLGISAPTINPSTFQAQYFATPYISLTPMDPTQITAIRLDHVSALEYWQLDRVAGGNTFVTLYWKNAALSQILLCASYQDISVAKWKSSNASWTNLDSTGGAIAGTCPVGTGYITTQVVVTSFSPFTFGSLKSKLDNPLPVELLSFTGKNLDGKNLLEWVTATETNNDFFVLEKSKDGIIFEELAKIDGAGTSNSLINYDEIDYDPYNPVTYYKLKQVDFNGLYTYSDIISISGEVLSDQPVFINLYPNPASTLVNLEVYSPYEGEMKVEIYDYLGMIIISEKGNVKKGYDVLSYDISKFADGIYYSRVFINDNVFIGYKKFVKE